MQAVDLLSHTRPMNLAYLAAFLRRHGFCAYIADYEVERYSDDTFGALLARLKPSVVGVSCMTPAVSNGARLCALAKVRDPRIVTVVGGAHANGLPRETLEEFSPFDCLVYGEGEATLLELCRMVRDGGSPESIPGLVHRRGNAIVRNPPRPLLDDLDELPFPARDLFVAAAQPGHSSRGFSNSLRSAELFTARGCPFSCSFCAIQTTFGSAVRFHSLGRIAAEVENLSLDGRYNHLVVADDTFTLDRERAREICTVIRQSRFDSWNCDTRVSTVSPDLLRVMAKSGCRKVAFGIESGSQRIMDLTGKGITVDQVISAVRWAREAGIPHIEGNFIIGADPGETLDDVEMTRKLILTLPWTFVSVSIIVPYPGTPVQGKMAAAGQIDPHATWEDFVMFGRPPSWHTDHFSAFELVALQKKLTQEFYLRPRYIMDRMSEIRTLSDATYWARAGVTYLRWYLSGNV
jgi:anaerobic magnesium-protoporphyrin IX monomethyl ester cyclase